MIRTAVTTAVALSTGISTASAETITVCASGCDYTSINAAIAAASDGDVIQLAAETYFEGDTINTAGKSIMLRGELHKSGEPATILDGKGLIRVVECSAGEGYSTEFENLVVRDGQGQIGQWGGLRAGGGMAIDNQSSPTVRNCMFLNNRSDIGGGVLVRYSGPRFEGCVFRSNQSQAGGGMTLSSDNALLNRCVFEDNWATGPVANGGGGVEMWNSNAVLNDCVFLSNSSTESGAGVSRWGGAPAFVGCAFINNDAIASGGGLCSRRYGMRQEASIIRCAFLGNRAWAGGGMANRNVDLNISECQFESNVAEWQGGAIDWEWTSGSLGNLHIDGCVFETNTAGESGPANFLDAASATSVVMTNCQFSECCQVVPVNFGNDLELGNELGWPCVGCVGDVTCDAVVNAADLGRLLGAWKSDQQRYDLNEDGIVDAADLGLLLGSWGACE